MMARTKNMITKTNWQSYDWRQKGSVTIPHAAWILSYSPEKIRQLIKAKILDARGKGSGQRVIVASITGFLAEESPRIVSNLPGIRKEADTVASGV
jgi:hypothetical protein